MELTTTKPAREKIEEIERALSGLPQVDCPIRHIFVKGLYAREMSIPADTVVTGAVHKVENLAVLSKGAVILSTPDGPKMLRAPYVSKCMPGVKNALVALEDSVWTNFFATEETDPDKLVEQLTESKASELLGGVDNKQLAIGGKSQPQQIKE